ncbi:unnamed protein product, partial [Sphacelaria rigidula]
ICQGWKADDVKVFRSAYIKCILATDLTLSLEYISKFEPLTMSRFRAGGKTSTRKHSGNCDGGSMSESLQNQILLLQMVLKVADVSHPCKPWSIHRKWSDLVTEEFFRQGDKELAQGFPVSPLCDRRERNLPKSQCDFINFIVRPCVTIFSEYCQVSTWSEHMDMNFKAWKVLSDE